MELSDLQLLDRYLAHRDEAAFRLLVERYLPLVHGVARRVTRSDDLARDVSQAVFLRLATRAAMIPAGLGLAAWLHRTTHSLAATLVRGEERRKKRERLMAAAEMNANDDLPTSPGWDALAPVIDRLVDSLPAADRELVLARYYRGEAHATIAARLGVNEALVRKRTSRALEKLRALLGKRGIATTSSALATLLPAHAVATPVPAALAGLILRSAQGITPLVPGGFHAALLVMNASQKILVATAAAVFLSSLGYAVRPAGPVPAATARADAPGIATTAPGHGDLRGRSALPETAEGRRERLHRIMARTSALDRRREMLAFTAQLLPEHFQDLCDAMDAYEDDPENSVRPEHLMLANAWTRKDPQAVLAALASGPSPDGGLLKRSYSLLAFSLGASHPAEAVKWAKERDGMVKTEMLCGVASVDLDAGMAALLEDVPRDQRASFLSWVHRNVDARPDLLARLAGFADPGAERTALLLDVADHEATSLPTLSLVRTLMADPEVMRQANVQGLFSNLSLTDPEGALAVLPDLEPGRVRARAVKGVAFHQAIHAGVHQAFALLDRYSEEPDDSTVAELVNIGMSRNPDGATMDHLERIGDPEIRAGEQARQLQWWMGSHPDAAREWIGANRADLPEAVDPILRSSAAGPVPEVDFRPLDTP